MALVFQSLNNANTTGPGTENFFDTPKLYLSMQISFSNGTPNVNLEGTVDGTNWSMITGGSTSGNIYTSLVTPVVGVRANLTIVGGSTGVSATIAAAD